MKHDEPLVATASQTVGPFFHFGLTTTPRGHLRDRLPAGTGEEIRLRINVLDGDGRPVTDAMIEVAQGGVFGRLPTDEQGGCEFETLKPGAQAGAAGAAGIDVYVFARGLLRHIQTRIYFPEAAGISSDPVLAIVPEDRRQTLFAQASGADLWTFDIRLQGANETVFFDA